MKNTITFAPLALACLLLSACSHSHDQTEQPSTESYLSLGEFPASRDVAKDIPVARYDEIFITKEVSTDNRKDGQIIRKALTEPFRVGLQAVATPVFNADGTSKMVLKGTFNCITRQYSPSSDPQMSIHLTRTYNLLLEEKAHPGDRLGVITSVPAGGVCAKDIKLPVILVNCQRVANDRGREVTALNEVGELIEEDHCILGAWARKVEGKATDEVDTAR